jgi:hypothetical protein
MNTRWHKVFIACHGAVLARNELEWRPLLADPQGGRRSLGAVLNDAVFVDCGCEGPQPSRPPPINVAAARMGIAGRSPGGRRSVSAVLNDAALVDCGCEGLQPSRPPPINVAAARMGIAGRSPGGRRPSAPC